MTLDLGKKKKNINQSYNDPDVEFPDKDFKSSRINMVKNLNEKMVIMNKHMENLNKERKTKKNQM